jgi:type II secretory pathway component PulM
VLAVVLLVVVCLRVLGRLEPLGRAQRRLQTRVVEAQALAAAADGLQARVVDLQKAAAQAQAGSRRSAHRTR